jgi:hypothetical protein
MLEEFELIEICKEYSKYNKYLIDIRYNNGVLFMISIFSNNGDKNQYRFFVEYDGYHFYYGFYKNDNYNRDKKLTQYHKDIINYINTDPTLIQGRRDDKINSII